MANSGALYFAAIVPSPGVKKEVLEMKMEIKQKFEVAHALKLPAHITLIPPVQLKTEQERPFSKALREVARQQSQFPVGLKNFGHFGHRVIFINVVDHEPLIELHHQLSKALFGFLSGDNNSKLHPHITLATRDLTREKFQKAWMDFQNRSYISSFSATAITLFKHNGKTWDVLEEYPFLGGEGS